MSDKNTIIWALSICISIAEQKRNPGRIKILLQIFQKTVTTSTERSLKSNS